MSEYSLLIVTPQGKIFDSQVESTTAPGTEGMFGILARHAPIVTSLKKGVVTVKTSSGQKFFAIGSGVLEMSAKNQCLILADTATEATNSEDAFDKAKNLK